MFDFENLRLGWRPNQYLMAPAGLCQHARPHTLSPTFNVPLQHLREAFMTMARRQPRAKVLEESNHAATLVQRSRVFRFPDIIDVRFVPLNGKRSTLAMYSRARYGVRDYGVNRARVRAWLELLRDNLTD